MRRQVTYAHRRNRNRSRVAQKPTSLPLRDIADPEQKLTHSETTHRMLKRSRHSGSGSSTNVSTCNQSRDGNFKKLKVSSGEEKGRANEQLNMDQIYELHTPHPTFLTESQKFKLESSRGLSLSPNHEFSPVPLVNSQPNLPTGQNVRPSPHRNKNQINIGLSRRTSSSNLKENAAPLKPTFQKFPRLVLADCGVDPLKSRPITKKKQAHQPSLASPFTSQPSSPKLLPESSIQQKSQAKVRSKTMKSNKITTMDSKRALSDTHYNPNLPPNAELKIQAQSTVNSPTRPEIETMKTRRPSAPSITARRPDIASWFVASDLSSNARVDPKPNSGRGGMIVDFNRPPSQLSYALYDDNFFDDVLGASTPFGLRTRAGGQQFLLRSENESMDSTDSEDDNGDHLSNRSRLGYLKYTPSDFNFKLDTNTPPSPISLGARPDCIRSPWLSDSLISPPTALQDRAYKDSPTKLINTNEYEDVNTGDEVSTTLGLGGTFHSSPSFGNDKKIHRKVTQTKDLKELELFGFDPGADDPLHPIVLRTRSLDLGAQERPDLHLPARISPSKAKQAIANKDVRGRNRRGTIRASDFQVQQVGVTIGIESNVSGPRRTRSGTIVGPTGPKRERSGTVMARPLGLVKDKTIPLSEDGDTDMRGPEKFISDNVPMSESEDELLLKDYWHDEDWKVAEPPSPIAPRRGNARNKGWIRRWEQEKNKERKKRRAGNSTNSWGMDEHDQDNGEDNELDFF